TTQDNKKNKNEIKHRLIIAND
ncbi:MAG: hypothetical protein RL626_871, partial [Pseudomonadota bacterium]